jgi:hypothetical protein
VITQLEQNHTKYEEVMGQPILTEGIRSIEKYFSFDDGIGRGLLKKKIREKLGLATLVP